MKKYSLLFLFIFFICQLNNAQSVIFLHHSTGGGVYGAGVADWISDYNTAHGTGYQIIDREYPNSPYDWKNYPYDFWYLWVGGACNSDYPGIECLSTLTEDYDVIIIKHCFPGAGIEEDNGSPDVASETKSLENYKLQYRALLAEMDEYPENKFIVWTLAPLHRNATDSASASRAKIFVDWVNDEWLTEDEAEHPNVSIFDFWGYVAESDPNPENGKVNCLKYNYEGDHEGNDSHPNSDANQYVAPIFAEFIVNTIEDTADNHSTNPTPVINKKIANNTIPNDLFYNADENVFTLNFENNQSLIPLYIEVYEITGKKSFQGIVIKGQAETDLKKGIYIVQVRKEDKILLTKKIFVN